MNKNREQLYLINEPVVPADIPEKVRRQAFGNLTGPLLILFDDMHSNILEKTASEQLAKILQFMAVSEGEYCVLNVAQSGDLTFADIKRCFPAEKLITFGLSEEKFSFLKKVPVNECLRFTDFYLVKTHSLAVLNEKPSEKKILAAALKELASLGGL